jgi:hypothetical protein
MIWPYGSINGLVVLTVCSVLICVFGTAFGINDLKSVKKLSAIIGSVVSILSLMIILTFILLLTKGSLYNGAKLDLENKRLVRERAESIKQIEERDKQIDELKRTPDFVYRDAIDLFNTNDYEGARAKFVEVLDKYPDSAYEKQAKDKIREIDRELARMEAEKKKAEKEAEEKRKYEPRSDAEAIAEWVDFRNNEDMRKGTITTWRFKITSILSECPTGHLGDDWDKRVAVFGSGGGSYWIAAAVREVPFVKEGDWVVVTGAFDHVSADGIVCLIAVKVINEGYR